MKKAAKTVKSKPGIKKKANTPAKKVAVKKPASKAAKKQVPAKKVAAKKVTKPVKKVTPKKAVAGKAKAKKEVKKVVKPAPKKAAKKVSPPVKGAVDKKNIKKPVVKAPKSKEEKNTGKSSKEKLEKKVVANVVVAKPRKRSKGGRKPKGQDDDDEPTLDQDFLVDELIKSTKRLKSGKKAKVPKQIRTFSNPMASLTVADDTAAATKKAAKKEPKGKFEIEYVIRTSPGILYEFLTSPSGLSEWFADDVNIHDGVFTFFWEGSEQKAKLLGFKEDKFIKLQWLDKPIGTYFEFRIERDELTGDISLMVVDFADEEADMKTSKLLWDSQINDLLNVIGSY